MTQYDINKLAVGIQAYQDIMLTSDTFTKVYGANDVVHLEAEATLSYYPKCCHKCGCVNPSKAQQKEEKVRPILHLHGYKMTHIKNGILHGYPLIINLKKQRYKCLACHQTFVAETKLVAKHCQISHQTKLKVANELTKAQSMKDIAEREGVSASSVIRIARRFAQRLETGFKRLPSSLCFDEFASTKQADAGMSFIMMDGLTHEVLDIIDSRQQKALLAYFYRYPRAARNRVKQIVIDMYAPYIGLIKSCFPNADIIIDRFHIIQHLNRALNKHRITVMNACKTSRPTDYTKLKRYWKLILKNADDLEFEHHTYHRLFGGLMSQKRIVDYLLSLDPRLEATYRFVNRLKQCVAEHDAEQFAITLAESKKVTLKQHVRTAFNSLEKYKDYIQNALTYRLSNGPLEGMNNRIKLLKRTGYGYVNFWNLRARILMMVRFGKTSKQAKPLYFEDIVA